MRITKYKEGWIKRKINGNGVPWNKGKNKNEFPQMSNAGVKKGFFPWNKGTKGLQIAWNKGQHIQTNTGRTHFKKGQNSGEKCHLWRGGITPLNNKIRSSFKMIQWIKNVFKRDNYTCVWCKQRGGKLNADHIKMFAFYPKLRFEISNGQTLCKICHTWKTKMDNKIFKGKIPVLNYA